MTTTKIWYTPAAADSATFDVPGASDDPTKTVTLSNFVRQENNRYRWQYVTGGLTAHANVSATNWGNTTLSSYTFAGGGTIPASQGQILINGRWEIAWNLVSLNSVRQALYFTSTNHLGGNVDTSVDTITAPPLNPKTAYSPYQDYIITGADVTGGSANTIQNVKFFANTKMSAFKISGSGEPTGSFDVSTPFVYTIQRRWEVNLHSSGSSLSFDFGIGQERTQTANYFQSGTEILENYFDSGYAESGYISGVNVGGYVYDDYVGAEIVTEFQDGVLAGLLRSAQTSIDAEVTGPLAVSQVTASANASMQLSVNTVITGGRLHQASATIDAIQSNLSVRSGIIAPLGSTIAFDLELADVVASRLSGGSCTESIDTATELVAKNIIGISDGIGTYFVPDYTDPDYIENGTGLTISDACQLRADASIIRSDGTLSLEGAFAATVQPGFRIDAGVVTTSSAEVEIKPYLTGGTGLLFAGQAEIQADSTTDFLAGSIAFGDAALEITARLDEQVQNIKGIAAQLEISPTVLVSDSESRPSIKISLGLFDSGSFTATADVTQTSTSNIRLANSEVQALAGYLRQSGAVFTQEISADFASEGRIYYIDEYFLVQVEPETRLQSAVQESRGLLVESETRVNTIDSETRGLLVEPETRQLAIPILPTTLVGARLRRIPA